jgi:biopolymer transport protein ExbD
LICIGFVFARFPHERQGKVVGLDVRLASACPAGQDERRDTVVRYLQNGKFLLNEQAVDEPSMLGSVSLYMETRAEKVVWIAADEHVSYGEVVSIISKLKRDTPQLYIALATKRQTGPVDPVQIDAMSKHEAALVGVGGLCL